VKEEAGSGCADEESERRRGVNLYTLVEPREHPDTEWEHEKSEYLTAMSVNKREPSPASCLGVVFRID
jgi:hypothetical protein